MNNQADIIEEEVALTPRERFYKQYVFLIVFFSFYPVLILSMPYSMVGLSSIARTGTPLFGWRLYVINDLILAFLLWVFMRLIRFIKSTPPKRYEYVQNLAACALIEAFMLGCFSLSRFLLD